MPDPQSRPLLLTKKNTGKPSRIAIKGSGFPVPPANVPKDYVKLRIKLSSGSDILFDTVNTILHTTELMFVVVRGTQTVDAKPDYAQTKSGPGFLQTGELIITIDGNEFPPDGEVTYIDDVPDS
jgi:hypothetical protein